MITYYKLAQNQDDVDVVGEDEEYDEELQEWVPKQKPTPTVTPVVPPPIAQPVLPTPSKPSGKRGVGLTTKINYGKYGRIFVGILVPAGSPINTDELRRNFTEMNDRMTESKDRYSWFSPSRGSSRGGYFTKLVTFRNKENIVQELNDIASSLGVSVDTTELDSVVSKMTAQQQESGMGNDWATKGTDAFIQEMEQRIQNSNSTDVARDLSQMIDEKLKTLAGSLDDKEQQDLLRQMFQAGAKFHNYSFHNQLLILFQSEGNATYVKGSKQWEGNGFWRRVKEGERGIGILAYSGSGDFKAPNDIVVSLRDYISNYVSSYPRYLNLGRDRSMKNQVARRFYGQAKGQLSKNVYDYLKKVMSRTRFIHVKDLDAYLQKKAMEGQGDRVKGYGRFKPVLVYDIAQTEPIPGHEPEMNMEEPAFEDPITDEFYLSEWNDEDERADMVLNSVLAYGTDLGIKTELEATLGAAKGTSSHKQINVSYGTQGQRQLAIVFHEMAHELLHWGEDPEMEKRKDLDKKTKEIDAQSTCYICMENFGFPAIRYSKNYLLMQGATGKDIMNRHKAISIATDKIITNTQQLLLKEIAKAKEAKQAIQSGVNWYRKIRKS